MANLPAPWLQQLPALLSLNLGYLSGNDLATWLNPELLISRMNVLPRLLQTAANQAVSEIQSKLINSYDLTTELLKTDVLPAIASCTVANGLINSVTLSNPGACYTSIPTVLVTPSAGDPGTGGVITAAISPSTLTKIQVLNPGRRFTVAPTITITGGGGDGTAAAVATINSWGSISSITITNPGAGFTSTPTIGIVGNGICAAAVAVVTFGNLTGLVITSAGTGYGAAPTLSFIGGQPADTRNPKLVKIMSIFAIRNFMGSMQSVSEKTQGDIADAEYMVSLIQGGSDNLPLYSAAAEIRSDVKVVYDRFRQLG